MNLNKGNIKTNILAERQDNIYVTTHDSDQKGKRKVIREGFARQREVSIKK